MSNLVVGDVVRVRGQENSPKMTISRIYPKLKNVTCVWFVGDSLNQSDFGLDAVCKV